MSNIDKERKEVKPSLSIHPNLEDRISKFQKECIIDELTSLPPIKEGDINISTDYIFNIGDKYEASIFIRNGLNSPINFEEVPLYIVDDKEEVIGSKVFNLREVGDIPPLSVRPWKVYFEKEELNISDDMLNDAKVVFGNSLKAEKTLKFEFEEFPEGIEGEEKRKYESFLENLPLLRNGQVSISAYNVLLNSNGELSIILVIRNGSSKNVKLEKLPITVKDARDIVIAKGVFELGQEGISVSSRKARLYSFVFTGENILEDEIHLNKWSVIFEC